MTEWAVILIAVAVASFFGAFLALALDCHLHIMGCHKRPDDEGNVG